MPTTEQLDSLLSHYKRLTTNIKELYDKQQELQTQKDKIAAYLTKEMETQRITKLEGTHYTANKTTQARNIPWATIYKDNLGEEAHQFALEDYKRKHPEVMQTIFQVREKKPKHE